MLLCGCPSPLPELNPARYASDKPGKQRMPQQAIEPEMEAQVEEEMEPPVDEAPQPGDGALSLSELLDVALRNNPETRIAWAQARQSAAEWGRTRSPYYPWLDGSVEGAGGRIPQLQTAGRSYIQLGVGLSYMLLDFGRGPKAEAARQALIAANWSHNQAIQDTLRDVPQAYYTYLADKAMVLATQQNLREATTTLRATENRKMAGVSTIADVLQARSQQAQVQLDLASAKGSREIAKGDLATTVGWPANSPLAVSQSLGEPPVHRLGGSVDELVELAKQQRPDLGAAQALVKQREAEVKKARALPFPTLNGTGTFGWFRARGIEQGAYYGGLTLSLPIFHGFDMENTIRSARADLEAARAQLKQSQNEIIKEVWDAYQNYRTAVEKLAASRALMASAKESFDASLARYKVGAADIVELLNAQSTLANARSESIGAKSGVYTSYAELVHAVGERVPGDAPPAIEERDEGYGEDR